MIGPYSGLYSDGVKYETNHQSNHGLLFLEVDIDDCSLKRLFKKETMLEIGKRARKLLLTLNKDIFPM